MHKVRWFSPAGKLAASFAPPSPRRTILGVELLDARCLPSAILPALEPFVPATTFQLHSRAGTANQVIYLDFNGSTTTGTNWNVAFTNGAPVFTPAYDTDGNTSAFGTAELQTIHNVWQRVAEDFIPFNVDVTTQDPGLERLRKMGPGDNQYGIRVVVGGDGSWYGSTGGVSFTGSFTWPSDTPNFVFSENLGRGNEKYTAEAITHEVGHTLGLSHDGTATSQYYPGQGSGETGWAPVMGTGYYQNLTQWSKGEYPGANNTQDDLSVITTQNGFGYRTDDHGNTLTAATSLLVSGSVVSEWGVIERNTDVDVFSVDVGAGPLTLNVNPAGRGADLDVLAQLFDAGGRLVASSNPTGLLSASISTSVAAGRYYLRVDGVGQGDPKAGGYSDYASLGEYAVSGTITPPTSVLPPPPASPPPVPPPPPLLPPPPPTTVASSVVVSNSSGGYRVGPGWITATGDRIHYGGDTGYFVGATGTSVARFTATLPAGTYRVSATWFATPDRATNAQFSLQDGAGTTLVSRVVSQTVAPNDLAASGKMWETVGTVTLTATGSLTVTLGGGQQNRYLDADAVRFDPVQPAIFAAAELPPTDGGSQPRLPVQAATNHAVERECHLPSVERVPDVARQAAHHLFAVTDPVRAAAGDDTFEVTPLSFESRAMGVGEG